MADKFISLGKLSTLRDWVRGLLTSKADKTELPAQATDTTLGLVKTNPNEAVDVYANGQLTVGGRLGQFLHGGLL